MGPALHLSWPSLIRAPTRTGGPRASSRVAQVPPGVSRQRTYPAAGYLIFKEQEEGGSSPILPVQGKLGQYAVHDLEVISSQGLPHPHK